MKAPKSILTYSNGKWGAGSTPLLDATNAGQKLLFIHALEDKTYEINGSFVATVMDGKSSWLEEVPYALIDVTRDNTADLNTALSKSKLLTTKEGEAQFLHNFHQKKYRFSVQPYTSIGPAISPKKAKSDTLTDAIIDPSDLKQGQMAWIGTTKGGALAIGYRPTDDELSNIQPPQNSFPYSELYANTLAVENQVISNASNWAQNGEFVYTLPQGELTSQMASELKPALFNKPIFAWLPKEGAWILCGKDGIGTQTSYILNGQWDVKDADNSTLTNIGEYRTTAFPAPSSDALAMHTTKGGLWDSNETGVYYYTGLEMQKRPGVFGKASPSMSWNLPYAISE